MASKESSEMKQFYVLKSYSLEMTLPGDSLYASALTYQIQIWKYGGQSVKMILNLG